ncbi:MAG: NAD(P)-dependent alcohol dehydrogenase [Pseudomonadota bacterium]|nr:NAD(P)-dependent alcohol dehydrogenase [Pseudomonadota bacterium]
MKSLCTDGGLAGLSIRDLPLPEPGPGEVRVRVRASAMNPADQKVLGGEFIGNFLHGKQVPIVGGYDVAGTVEALGASVTDLAVGDEVFGFLAYGRGTKRGAFAESAVVTASTLARRPVSLSPTDAAALATAGVTALQSLRDLGRLQAGQRVLVVGASGGVGSLAVGVAARLGAEVTGICGGAAAELVRSLGAARIIDRGTTVPDPARYHVIFDAAAAHSWLAMRSRLEPGGTYVTTLPGPGVFLGMAVAPLFGTRCAFISVAPKRADLELLATWVGEGMRVPIDSRFPVRDGRAAIERMARGGMKGRVVIDVEGGF